MSVQYTRTNESLIPKNTFAPLASNWDLFRQGQHRVNPPSPPSLIPPPTPSIHERAQGEVI